MSEKHIIQTPSLFKVDDSFQDNRFMRVRIAVMHSGKNLNNSKFTTSVIKAAKNTFANIPILANVIITTDKDGNQHMDYGSHDMHVEEDFFTGDERIIYDEKVVGVVPENNNFEIIPDEETGNDYVWVDALIYRDYGNYCADILEHRGGTTSVSAEISCEEISYDAQDKVLQVDKMTMCAVTLLGEDTKPGMAKAHATVFSIDEDSRERQMIDIIQELKQSLEKYIASYSVGERETKEGGNKPLFEELLKKYSKTVEEIDFEYEGLSDEELEALFAEHFEDAPKKKKKGEDDDVTPSGEGDDSGDDDKDDDKDDDQDDDGQNDDQDNDKSDDQQDEPDQNDQPDQNVNQETGYDANNANNDASDGEQEEVNYYSMTITKGDETKTFAVSLNDKIEALYSLVNNTYADADGDFYDVIVYDDSKEVVMRGYWSGRAYRQSYKVKKNNYTLVDERVEVKAIYVTPEEEKTLDAMKANYSSIESELASFKAEPEKQAVLAEKCYAQIADTEAYKKLAEQDTHFTMSVDEVRAELDKQLLEYAKVNGVQINSDNNTKKTFGTKSFGSSLTNQSGKKSRYGGIFRK